MIYNKDQKGQWVLHLVLLSLSFANVNEIYCQGAWMQPKGEWRIKIASYVQKSENRFASSNIICDSEPCNNGERTKFFFNGRSQSIGVFNVISYGLSSKSNISLETPFYSIQYLDDIDPERSASVGFGDLKLKTRYQWYKNESILVSTLVGVKAPIGFFNKDAEIVPIGDGQYDVEIKTQLSFKLNKISSFIHFDSGFRYRFLAPIQTNNFTPGHEIPFWLEYGIKLKKGLYAKTALNGFYGLDGVALLGNNTFFKRQNSARRILNMDISIYYELNSKWSIDLLVRNPLVGQNFTTVSTFGLGAMLKL